MKQEYNIKLDEHGLIRTYNGKPIDIIYNDDNYMVFMCEDRGYMLRGRTLYLISDYSFVRLLCKMSLIEYQCKQECLTNYV